MLCKDYWLAGTTRGHWLATLGLAVALFGTVWVAAAIGPHLSSGTLRAVAVLAPVPLMFALAYVEFARIRRTDELRQRIELEAGTLALAISVPLVTAFGLLDSTGVYKLPLIFVGPIICAVYVVAQLWAHRRYR